VKGALPSTAVLGLREAIDGFGFGGLLAQDSQLGKGVKIHLS
jgi:hypothetical protein